MKKFLAALALSLTVALLGLFGVTAALAANDTDVKIVMDKDTAIVGTAFEAHLSLSDGSSTEGAAWLIIGELPEGLTFDKDTGTISGTPTTACTSGFMVVKDPETDDEVYASLSLTVVDDLLFYEVDDKGVVSSTPTFDLHTSGRYVLKSNDRYKFFGDYVYFTNLTADPDGLFRYQQTFEDNENMLLFEGLYPLGTVQSGVFDADTSLAYGWCLLSGTYDITLTGYTEADDYSSGVDVTLSNVTIIADGGFIPNDITTSLTAHEGEEELSAFAQDDALDVTMELVWDGSIDGPSADEAANAHVSRIALFKAEEVDDPDYGPYWLGATGVTFTREERVFTAWDEQWETLAPATCLLTDIDKWGRDKNRYCTLKLTNLDLSQALLTEDGRYTLLATVTVGGKEYTYQSGQIFEVTAAEHGMQKPVIDTATLLPAGVGEAYQAQLAGRSVSAPSGTLTWSITAGSLPEGLTLDGATGVISGTPTEAGEATFTVCLTEEFSEGAQLTCEKELTLTVVGALETTGFGFGKAVYWPEDMLDVTLNFNMSLPEEATGYLVVKYKKLTSQDVVNDRTGQTTKNKSSLTFKMTLPEWVVSLEGATLYWYTDASDPHTVEIPAADMPELGGYVTLSYAGAGSAAYSPDQDARFVFARVGEDGEDTGETVEMPDPLLESSWVANAGDVALAPGTWRMAAVGTKDGVSGDILNYVDGATLVEREGETCTRYEFTVVSGTASRNSVQGVHGPGLELALGFKELPSSTNAAAVTAEGLTAEDIEGLYTVNWYRKTFADNYRLIGTGTSVNFTEGGTESVLYAEAVPTGALATTHVPSGKVALVDGEGNPVCGVELTMPAKQSTTVALTLSCANGWLPTDGGALGMLEVEMTDVDGAVISSEYYEVTSASMAIPDVRQGYRLIFSPRYDSGCAEVSYTVEDASAAETPVALVAPANQFFIAVDLLLWQDETGTYQRSLAYDAVRGGAATVQLTNDQGNDVSFVSTADSLRITDESVQLGDQLTVTVMLDAAGATNSGAVYRGSATGIAQASADVTLAGAGLQDNTVELTVEVPCKVLAPVQETGDVPVALVVYDASGNLACVNRYASSISTEALYLPKGEYTIFVAQRELLYASLESEWRTKKGLLALASAQAGETLSSETTFQAGDPCTVVTLDTLVGPAGGSDVAGIFDHDASKVTVTSQYGGFLNLEATAALAKGIDSADIESPRMTVVTNQPATHPEGGHRGTNIYSLSFNGTPVSVASENSLASASDWLFEEGKITYLLPQLDKDTLTFPLRMSMVIERTDVMAVDAQVYLTYGYNGDTYTALLGSYSQTDAAVSLEAASQVATKEFGVWGYTTPGATVGVYLDGMRIASAKATRTGRYDATVALPESMADGTTFALSARAAFEDADGERTQVSSTPVEVTYDSTLAQIDEIRMVYYVSDRTSQPKSVTLWKNGAAAADGTGYMVEDPYADVTYYWVVSFKNPQQVRSAQVQAMLPAGETMLVTYKPSELELLKDTADFAYCNSFQKANVQETDFVTESVTLKANTPSSQVTVFFDEYEYGLTQDERSEQLTTVTLSDLQGLAANELAGLSDAAILEALEALNCTDYLALCTPEGALCTSDDLRDLILPAVKNGEPFDILLAHDADQDGAIHLRVSNGASKSAAELIADYQAEFAQGFDCEWTDANNYWIRYIPETLDGGASLFADSRGNEVFGEDPDLYYGLFVVEDGFETVYLVDRGILEGSADFVYEYTKMSPYELTMTTVYMGESYPEGYVESTTLSLPNAIYGDTWSTVKIAELGQLWMSVFTDITNAVLQAADVIEDGLDTLSVDAADGEGDLETLAKPRPKPKPKKLWIDYITDYAADYWANRGKPDMSTDEYETLRTMKDTISMSEAHVASASAHSAGLLKSNASVQSLYGKSLTTKFRDIINDTKGVNSTKEGVKALAGLGKKMLGNADRKKLMREKGALYAYSDEYIQARIALYKRMKEVKAKGGNPNLNINKYFPKLVPRGKGTRTSRYPSGKIDPSGFVYEAVESNRISGATVKLYTYGAGANFADAELYGLDEANPQITGANGTYQWFVPQGYWQVEVSKSGYETVSTGSSSAYGTDATKNLVIDDGDGGTTTITSETYWLPVFPVQLDVNIGLVSYQAPTVVEDAVVFGPQGITVEFSKYMDVASVEQAVAKGCVTVGGRAVPFVQAVNAEPLAANEDVMAATTFLFAYPCGLLKAGENSVAFQMSFDSAEDKPVSYAGTALLKSSFSAEGSVTIAADADLLEHHFEKSGCSRCGAGDVNENGVVNIVDAQIAYDMGCACKYAARADVRSDGFVDAVDARAIQTLIFSF